MRPPIYIQALTISYAILLIAGLLLYLKHDFLMSWVPASLGPVPTAVPWLGSLGGILIALRGLYLHGYNWLPRYAIRYVTRPLTGAVCGSIAYLIYVLLIASTGVSAKLTNTIAYDVVSFIAGYREETFRELLIRATDATFGKIRA